MTKHTCFFSFHEKLGAKISPFAGFEMPIVYNSIKEEHQSVRNKAGLFDVSHMGEFLVEGENALNFLQKVVSNDVAKLGIGQVQYAYLPNEKGGIVDDLLVYCLAKNRYMLVVNAANIEKDFEWLSQQNSDSVQLTDISDQTALLALQGPKAVDILSKLCEEDVKAITYYHFTHATVAGIENVLVSATGYTGAGGFELYVSPVHGPKLWEAIWETGKAEGLAAAGLAARDTLRLEMGYCLYGNDIDDTTSPLEAGLGWITKFNKDFIAKDLLLQQKTDGLKRKLVGFELLDRGIPRKDYRILDEKEEVIGRVTSGTQSPSLGKAIGLGYVEKKFAKVGTEFFIEVRKKRLRAKVVKLPFWKG